MKTIGSQFFLALLLFITTTAFSQDSKSQAQKMTDKMKTDLNLTDEQTLKALPINQSFIESIQALRSADSKLTKYRVFKAADDERDNAMKEILTKDQYRLFKKIKEENREALKEARKNKGQ
jgi:hypothetical protein